MISEYIEIQFQKLEINLEEMPSEIMEPDKRDPFFHYFITLRSSFVINHDQPPISSHDGSKQGLRRIVYLFLGNKRDYSDDMNIFMRRTMVTMKIMNAGGETYLCNIIIIKCVMCLKIIIK